MSSRRVRRSDDTLKTKQGYTTQREGEISSRRSPRGNDNLFKLSNGKKDPYCVTYFKNNPDSMDMRTPSEKLQELNDRLDAELNGDITLLPSEKFKILTQIKSITYMINGEDSAEMVRAYANLGYFYNDNNRPQSAIRNLEKAHNLERSNRVDDDVKINIAAETAKAYLSIKHSRGSSNTKQVAQADEALSPYYEKEIERIDLRYKRDLTRSRIFARQKKYDEAIKSYEMAVKSLKEVNEDVITEEEANLFVEMGQIAEKKHKKMLASQNKSQSQTQDQSPSQTQTQSKDQTQNSNQSEESYEQPQIPREAGIFYHRAYDIFTKLGMEEKAKSIEPLLLNDDYSYYYYDEEEEEEEEATDTLTNSHEQLQEDKNEHVTFAPREPSEETGSKGSTRRRQFREKQGDEAENPESLEKKQEDIASGLLNNQNEEESNPENPEEENNENNQKNEEEEEENGETENRENANGENPVSEEEENNENGDEGSAEKEAEKENADESVLNEKKDEVISGLVGDANENKD